MGHEIASDIDDRLILQRRERVIFRRVVRAQQSDPDIAGIIILGVRPFHGFRPAFENAAMGVDEEVIGDVAPITSVLMIVLDEEDLL
ncbi:MAG: hypothetical protein A3J74_08765 [Elusimicrobia bacterium RIFCSPHIGHO2_02_FULL_57_9]|nr:MAG: hypothetical protein A3J74_08765 [Elusimicrobia bacterium RIFCSPHIGHO2_02_FULL_57_9]